MVSAEFHPTKEVYTFAEVLEIVRDNLRSQINREHLEKLFSYNVSNEKLLAARAVPLFLKNIAMKLVYTKSALANTTTITNIGNIGVDEEYRHMRDVPCISCNVEGTAFEGNDLFLWKYAGVLIQL